MAKKIRKDVPLAVRVQGKMPAKYSYRHGKQKRPSRRLSDERHAKVGIVGQTHPGSEYTDDEREFMVAMDRYKRDNRRPFPTWHEVLQVVLSLGYRKVAEKTALPVHPK